MEPGEPAIARSISAPIGTAAIAVLVLRRQSFHSMTAILGVAAIGAGIATIGDNDVAYGVALIVTGVAAIGGGIALIGLFRRDHSRSARVAAKDNDEAGEIRSESNSADSDERG